MGRDLGGEANMASMHVALLRGINVGRAKRVAMADLRALVEKLGYGDVRTLLNSGNVVFSADATGARSATAKIEQGLEKKLGVSSRVIVVSADQLSDAVTGNPLAKVATNPSRMMVAFLARPEDRALLTPLTRKDWKPERFALGARVAYIWCPDGILESPLSVAVNRALGDAVTVRNWATTTKLLALARPMEKKAR